MLIISLIINITLLALMLYYKKMLKIELEKNQKLLLRIEKSKTNKTTADPDAAVKKIMRQTGLTYDLALQIHNGNDNIKVKTSNNKIKKPIKTKF